LTLVKGGGLFALESGSRRRKRRGIEGEKGVKKVMKKSHTFLAQKC